MPERHIIERLFAERVDDIQRWNSCVDHAPSPDAYYRAEYVQASALMERTEPGALIVNVGGARYLLPSLGRTVETSVGPVDDVATPYGYGGVLPLDDSPPVSAVELIEPVREFCRTEGKVAFALRLNPLLRQYEWFAPLRGTSSDIQFQRVGTTYAINLVQWDEVARCPAGMAKGRRSDLAFARRRLRVELREDEAAFCTFHEIYEATMERKAAAPFLRPDFGYFDALRKLGKHIFVALAFDSRVAVGGALFLLDREFAHYHFSGTTDSGRGLKATTLLIVEAAAHARARGCRALHLGGGIRDADSLSSFKKSFGGTALGYASVLLIVDSTRFRQVSDSAGPPWPYCASPVIEKERLR